MLVTGEMQTAIRVQERCWGAYARLEIARLLQAAGVPAEKWPAMIAEIGAVVVGPDSKEPATVTPLKAVETGYVAAPEGT